MVRHDINVACFNELIDREHFHSQQRHCLCTRSPFLQADMAQPQFFIRSANAKVQEAKNKKKTIFFNHFDLKCFLFSPTTSRVVSYKHQTIALYTRKLTKAEAVAEVQQQRGLFTAFRQGLAG